MMRLFAIALLALVAAGCSSTYYDWGRYQDSVYLVTNQPDGFDVQAEIDALEEQLEETQNDEGRVPPGLLAHLGFLHASLGNLDQARNAFESEKRLFPESAVFIDGILARMGGTP